MRSFLNGSLALGFIAVAAIGCSSKGTTTSTGAGGTTGSTVSSTTKATSGSMVTTSTTGSTSSGMTACSMTTELLPAAFKRTKVDTTNKNADFTFDPGKMLGGAAPDTGDLQFYDLTLTGKQDLALAGVNDNYGTCTTCVLVNEDVDPMTGAKKVYFQKSGTLDLGTTTIPAITGTMTDVTLQEVTIDTMFNSTPVAGGACLHITSANFAFDKAPAGWTCDPALYGDKANCDCNACGVVDPDCAITPALPVNGCGPGQTCGADGKSCMGTVTGWTCAQAKYNENHNVPMASQTGTCDCACGLPDPDCANTTAQVVGCNDPAAPKCNANGLCLPTAWTCNPSYYGDKGQPGGGCDCGCGVKDIDCADLNSTSCDFCNDPSGTGFAGSCDASGMDCSAINATNNAVCTAGG